MRKRFVPILILVIYSALLVNIMVFKYMPIITVGHIMLNFGGTHEGAANLIPFKTILPYLLGQNGFIIAFINIAGNIALLVPVGFMVAFINRSITWKKMLAIAVAAGLTIECMQALLHVGIFDIDDVILNGLGVMLGFWAFTIGTKMQHSARVKAITVAAVLVAAAGVFCGVMLSHDARQPLPLPRTEGGVLMGDNDSNGVKHDSLRPTALLNTANDSTAQLPDPCGGTGGTGQIISVGNHAITIQSRSGKQELVKIGPRTKIKDARGALAEEDLKVGYRVTVVIGLEAADDRLASAVLVCKGGN